MSDASDVAYYKGHMESAWARLSAAETLAEHMRKAANDQRYRADVLQGELTGALRSLYAKELSVETRGLMVCTPMWDMVSGMAVASTTAMLLEGQMYWLKKYGEKSKFEHLVTMRTEKIPARVLMVEEVLKTEGIDRVLWLDDDAYPPSDLIERLDAHDEAMVTPMAFKRWSPHEGMNFDKEWKLVNPLPPRLHRVHAGAFHCMWMKAEVVRAVAEKYGKNGIFREPRMGEDVAFCHQAAECGFELWCDSTISVGHVTTQIVTEAHYKAFHADAGVSGDGPQEG